MKCPYCTKEATWVENKVIYGRNYVKSYMAWWCGDCRAYVGCHQNTKKPLGTMANAELRQWRRNTHTVIDPLWKSGKYKRSNVYRMLSDAFHQEIHIGEADVEGCKAIIETVSILFKL